MATVAELRTTLGEKRAEHGAFLAGFKTDDGLDMSVDQVGEFNKRNDELTELQKAYEIAAEVEKSAAVNDAHLASQGRVVTEVKEAKPTRKENFNGAFTKGVDANADMLKNLAGGGTGTARWALPAASTKTIIDIADITNANDFVGYAPDAVDVGDVEAYLPHGVISSNNIRYYIQNADTSNAAFVANVTAATDAVLTWTLTTDQIEDIQAWIPIGRDILSDIPMLLSFVTGQLMARLQKVVAASLLVGDGTTPDIWGMFTRTNFQTQAKGADPTMDAVHKGMTKLANVGAQANLAVFHPSDWEAIRLTRTGDGIYLLGSPTEAGPSRLWGVPVVTSIGMTENTGGVVDTSFTQIFTNGGLNVEISTEHSTYYTERKLALALSRRLGVAHYLPTSACTITGI